MQKFRKTLGTCYMVTKYFRILTCIGMHLYAYLCCSESIMDYAVLFFMIQRYVMRFKMYYKAMVLIKVNIILND